jgi:hypothetical protein
MKFLIENLSFNHNVFNRWSREKGISGDPQVMEYFYLSGTYPILRFSR